jgi:putative heme-binding domain-containing protein
LGARAAAAQDVPTANPTPADVDAGKQTFEQRCSVCHGLDGGGAMGPNIQGIPMRIGAPIVANTIKNGVTGAMPAFAGQLTDAQIQQVIAYLLTLTRKDSATVTGDAAKGKLVYDSSGCASCHIIAGEGGDSGPELTTIGKLRGAGYLKTTLLYPGSDLPQARVFLETGGLLDYMHIHLVAKSGQAFEGTRVVEDSFHIVIQDVNGNFHSFRKADLKELEKQPGKSVMPSFKDKLSPAQVDDLVAYLASLKGAQ